MTVKTLIEELKKHDLKKEINISLSYNNNHTIEFDIYESDFYVENVGNYIELRNNDYYKRGC